MSLFVRYQPVTLGGGSGGGGGGSSTPGLIKATLNDPVDTSLPSSAPTTIDGVVVTTGMTVLFSNLSTGNNEVYLATVSGSSISWVAQSIFPNGIVPLSGDTVIFTQGTAFADQVAVFNGTSWQVNNPVRYFNGANYFEQSALITSTLADATTNGTVFSVAYAGSQNQIVEYSVIRGSAKEVGTINLTTDGTNVGISVDGSSTAPTGVSFSAVISGSNLILQYTTTSTGSAATMMYNVRRWSDSSGGPAGLPSYTGGSSTVAAAGSNGNIQINSAGNLGASSNFSYDAVNNLVELGGMQVSILESAAIADNQVSPTTFLTIPTSYNAVVIDYSVNKSGNFRTGRILYATDGTNVSITGDYVEQGTTGVTISATVSGSNVNVQYTSTATGAAGTLKYSFRQWAA
jgi:hypothetical protein